MFFMKKFIGLILINLLFVFTAVKAQVTAEPFAMNPQTGSHNYFGVRVTLPHIYDNDVTVTGFIYDDGNGPNTNNPFSLTVTSGNLTAETAANFYQTDPTASAAVDLGSIAISYGGVIVTYEAADCILKFNSIGDLKAVIDQLDADYDNYNDDYDSQYPNLTEEQLDDMDEQNGFDEFQTFKNFENMFGGFCSKRAEIDNTELTWLDNNFSGVDPDDIDLTYDNAENTIFNNTYSFKIGNDVYQLTTSGVFINGILQEDGGNSYIINNESKILFAGNLYANLNYSSGPMASNEDIFSNCKTNKRLRSPVTTLPGTNRATRLKVAIHSIGIMHSIKGKVVHFKMKNGKPKRARARIAVRVDALVRDVVCTLIDPVAKNDPQTVGTFNKRKELRVRVSHIGGPIWRAFQGDVVSSYTTQDGFTDQLPLTW